MFNSLFTYFRKPLAETLGVDSPQNLMFDPDAMTRYKAAGKEWMPK